MTTDVSAGKPRGVLYFDESDPNVRLRLYPPCAPLADHVEHHWIIRWDLRGHPPRVSQNLPHPSVHMVFECGRTGLHGVMGRKFVYQLEGAGTVYGVKFRPGAFYPFFRSPVSSLTNGFLTLHAAFGLDDRALEEAVLACSHDADMVAIGEGVLLERLPEPDEGLGLIHRLVEHVATDRSLTKVEDLERLAGLGKRSLQRLFKQYVGVGPKWVLKRYRLVEAADTLAAGDTTDWPEIALALGYFDQAHFIKDFKAMIGTSPAQYVAECRSRRQGRR